MTTRGNVRSTVRSLWIPANKKSTNQIRAKDLGFKKKLRGRNCKTINLGDETRVTWWCKKNRWNYRWAWLSLSPRNITDGEIPLLQAPTYRKHTLCRPVCRGSLSFIKPGQPGCLFDALCERSHVSIGRKLNSPNSFTGNVEHSVVPSHPCLSIPHDVTDRESINADRALRGNQINSFVKSNAPAGKCKGRGKNIHFFISPLHIY